MKRLLLSLLLLLPLPAFAAGYSDVPLNHPSFAAISELTNRGVLRGTGDGLFHPNNSVSRAELLKMLFLTFELTQTEEPSRLFPDVEVNTWFHPYIASALLKGIASGYPDGHFRPHQTVSRIEALKIILSTIEFDLTRPSSVQFNDVPETSWYAPYVRAAVSQKLLDQEGRLFFPNRPMTRSETAELMYRTLLIYLNDQPFPVINAPLDARREQALDLLNQLRREKGLSQLVLDYELTAIAQNHSDDMKKRAFFAHENPDGQTVDDRRKLAGIKTPVSENLAFASSGSVNEAHDGLIMSPSHYANMTEPDWQRVGIGVTSDQDGGILMTQVFSYFEPTTTDITKEQSGIEGFLLGLRPDLSKDSGLTTSAEEWSQAMATVPFFSVEHTQGSLIELVRKHEPHASVRTFIFQHSLLPGLLEQLHSEDIQTHLIDQKWKRFGLGVRVDRDGLSLLTLILAD